MNKVFLSGRLTRTPELRTSKDGNTKILSFSIANNVYNAKTKENNAVYFNCIAWNKIAEYIEKKAQKGTYINFEGNLMMNEYYNKENKKINQVLINVEKVEYIEKANNTNHYDGDFIPPVSSDNSATTDADPIKALEKSTDDLSLDDELPF